MEPLDSPSLRPKRPPSALFLYAKEVQERLASEHPELKSFEVRILANRRFKELSDEERDVY